MINFAVLRPAAALVPVRLLQPTRRPFTLTAASLLRGSRAFLRCIPLLRLPTIYPFAALGLPRAASRSCMSPFIFNYHTRHCAAVEIHLHPGSDCEPPVTICVCTLISSCCCVPLCERACLYLHACTHDSVGMYMGGCLDGCLYACALAPAC